MENQRIHREKSKLNINTGVISMLILLIFRIPLANMVGNEGNGYLAISWEIYGIFFLLFGYGYSKIITQMVGTRIAKKMYRNSIKAASTVVLAGFLSSLLGGGLLYLLSDIITEKFFGTAMAGISLKLFAPLLVTGCLLRIYRGYFEGTGTGVPTEASRLIEGLITATGVFIFVYLAGDYGTKVGALLHNEQFSFGFKAAGAVAGYLCGSILALVFMGFVYILYKTAFNRLLKRDLNRSGEKRKELLKAIYAGIPLILLEILFIRLYRIVNIYLYSLYRPAGSDFTQWIGDTGSFYGKVSVLMVLAIVIVLWFSARDKHRSRKHLVRDEFRNGKQLMAEELGRLFAIALPIGVSFIILAEQILKTLFGNASQVESNMLRVGGVSVILISLGVYLYRMLFTLQLKKQGILIQLVAFIGQTVIMVILNRTPFLAQLSLNRLSMGIAEFVFWFVFSAAALVVLMRLYRIRLRWSMILLPPMIQTFVMLLIEVLIVGLLGDKLSAWMVCGLAIIAGGFFHQITGRLPFLNQE